MGATGKAAGAAPAKSQPTPLKSNTLLLVGGYFSIAFSIFQLSGIWWPARGIKYFGGPAELSIHRPVAYAFLCLVVAAVVAVFGCYALSAAGKIRRLPLLRTVLTAVTAIYLLRGLLVIPQAQFVFKHPEQLRFAVFSLIALIIGLIHLGGLLTFLKHGRPDPAVSKP